MELRSIWAILRKSCGVFSIAKKSASWFYILAEHRGPWQTAVTRASPAHASEGTVLGCSPANTLTAGLAGLVWPRGSCKPWGQGRRRWLRAGGRQGLAASAAQRTHQALAFEGRVWPTASPPKDKLLQRTNYPPHPPTPLSVLPPAHFSRATSTKGS